MDTKVTCIDRHDSLRPVGPQATQSLLDEKKIPALQEHEYQQWAEYLFSAPLPLQLQVTGTLFCYDRQHPRALALFLACAVPLAKLSVRRTMLRLNTGSEITEELMYDGAVKSALKLFQTFQPRHSLTVTSFNSILFSALKTGTFKPFDRQENNMRTARLRIKKHRHATPRLVEYLTAKQMLEKIANLEPSPYPHFNPIQKFLRCLILQIGPDNALNPCTDSRNNPRALRIDLTLLANELGISRNTAQGYLLMARPLLKQLFNQDGTLFTRAAPR